MVTAILCPGPSLGRLTTTPAADRVIAVNRAALWHACGTWACNDWFSAAPGVAAGGFGPWHTQVRGSPLLLTGAGAWGAIRRRGWTWPAGAVTHDALACPVALWGLYSTTAAVVYAASQGARRITLYGADMAGTADADGVAAGSNRSESRWARERGILLELAQHYAGRGIEVDREQL